MAKSNFDTDEFQMKLLKDKALFSDSNRVRFQSIKALAAEGSRAAPFIAEVLESSNDTGFKRYCSELLENIKQNHSRELLGAFFALAPCVILESCTMDGLPF